MVQTSKMVLLTGVEPGNYSGAFTLVSQATLSTRVTGVSPEYNVIPTFSHLVGISTTLAV